MDFTQLTAYVDSIPALGVPGCDLIVYRDHREIYRHMAGHRDVKGLEKIRGDEDYFFFSCTKVFTTCAAMQLIDRGLLRLDDPVSDYLPAYREMTVREGDQVRPAKRPILVRHLMSMQSGMTYDLDTPAIRQVLKEAGDKATTRQLVDAKAQDPLNFDPGEDFLYSASHDVLAAVIEAASGQRFSDYLREHIFAPLGIKNLSFSVDAPERLCAQFVYDGEKKTFEPCALNRNNYRLSLLYESGGAGLVGDVESYITFADALACGGKGKDGQVILAPEMMQLWSANQLGPRARKSFDGWNRKGYSYALGVRTRVDLSQGGAGAIGEFGWDGAAGAWTMIDPHHHLSAFFAMHVRNYGYSYDVIHPTIRSLIYEGLEK